MIPAKMWMRAAESGYARPDDWKNWADNRIAQLPFFPNWLIDMSLAQDVTQLHIALVEELANESGNPAFGNDRALLGYLALRFNRGDLTLNECLIAAGDLSDGNDTGVPCETFYELSNRLREDPEAGAIDARHVLESLANTATSEWDELQRWMPA